MKKQKNNQQSNVSNLTLGLLGVAALVLAAVISFKTLGNKPVVPTVIQVSKPELPLSNTVDTKDVQLVGRSFKKLNIDFTRAVFLMGEVNETIVQQIQQISELSSLSSEPIYLMIESPGGSVFDGYKMLSAMESSRAPVYTVCVSICASMAFIIHQYGVKRYMFDRATLMAHDASGGLQGDVKKMTTRLTYLNRMLEKTDRKIASRIGISYEAYNQMHQNELWLDAEDSVKLRFADEVIATEYPSLLNTQNSPPPEENRRRSHIPKLIDVQLKAD